MTMSSTVRLLLGLPKTSGAVLATLGLALMWSYAAVAQTTTTTTTVPPGGVQPGVRPATPPPAAPSARTPGPGQTTDQSAREASVLRGPRPDQLEGIPLGGFVVHPRLAVDFEFDDNVYRTQNNRVSDFVFRVRPGVTVDSDWEQHALQFYAEAELARWASNAGLNYESFIVGTRGRFDIDDEFAVNGMAEFARINIPQGQPGSVGPALNSITHQFTTGMSLSYNGDPFYARIGPRFQRVIYVEGDGGVNQNYSLIEIAARVGYKITPELSVFLDPSYQWVRYDNSTDPFGFQRDSEGYDIRVGVAYDITRTITAEIGLGYFHRTFRDARTPPIGGLSGLARLYWNPTDTISIELEAKRGVTEYRT